MKDNINLQVMSFFLYSEIEVLFCKAINERRYKYSRDIATYYPYDIEFSLSSLKKREKNE